MVKPSRSMSCLRPLAKLLRKLSSALQGKVDCLGRQSMCRGFLKFGFCFVWVRPDLRTKNVLRLCESEEPWSGDPNPGEQNGHAHEIVPAIKRDCCDPGPKCRDLLSTRTPL